MKRIIIIPAILLICLALIVGCSGTGSTTTTVAPSQSTSKAAASQQAPATNPAAPATQTAPALSQTTSAQSPVSTAQAAPKQQYGGTMRLITSSVPGSPIGWMPETSGISANIQQISLDLLLWEDITGKMIPHLATSYEINSDPANPSVTFKLRKGVKFHDGSDFNAQSVKWCFEQTKSSAVSAAVTRVWKSFDVLDDYTIRVNYTQWQNQLIRSFNTSTTMIFSKAAYDKNGLDWMRWNMVGTGPFKHTEYQKDVILKAVKNENYWETGKPFLKGIDFIFVADELTQMALFKTGGGEVLQCSPKNAIELKGAGYQIVTRMRNTNMLLPDSMNADSPWSNLKVRQAADYAIDKEAIAKAFGYGYYQAAYQIAPPNSTAFIPSITGRKYDVAKAKQLLVEAGYPNGFKTKIICGTVNKDINAAYQAYLAAVGIQAELDIAEPARGQQLMAGGTWNNALLNSGVVLYANFNNILAQWFGVPSTFFKSTKKPDGYEALLNASINSAAPDPALMQKCVQSLYDDATVLTTVYDTAHWAMTTNVRDSGIGEFGGFSMWAPESAWISK